MRRLPVVLRRRDLRLLVAGSTVSLVGDGVYAVAMAVAVLQSAGTASALAAMAVANLAPRVVFGLYGGVLADRVSRRLVLASCDLLRLAVVAGLGLVLLAGPAPLWVLLGLVAPLGAASGAAAPAFTALVPDLVEDDELVAANGLLSSVSPLAQLVAGPVLGGVLAAYDVGVALLVDAATFAVSALCVLLLRPQVGPVGPAGGKGRPLPWAHFREGLAHVRRTPWLATNLAAGLVITFAVSGSLTMLPFLVRAGYHEPTSRFGFLLAVGGVSATLSAVLVSSHPAPRRRLRASYLAYVVGLAAVAGLGLAPGLALGAVCSAVFFAGATVGNVLQDSVLGSQVPRELRGRVSSLDWVAATAAQPLSVVVAAVAADRVGIRTTYLGAGGLAVLASLAGLLLLRRTGEPGAALVPLPEPAAEAPALPDAQPEPGAAEPTASPEPSAEPTASPEPAAEPTASPEPAAEPTALPAR